MTTERQAVVSINFKPGNTVKVAEEIRNELAKPPSGGWFPGLEDRLKAAQTRFSEIGKHARVIPAFSAAPRPAMKFGDGETIGTMEAAVARHQLMARAVRRRAQTRFDEDHLPSQNPRPEIPNTPVGVTNLAAANQVAPTSSEQEDQKQTVEGREDEQNREEVRRSFTTLATSAQGLATAFDRTKDQSNQSSPSFDDYKREREEIVSPVDPNRPHFGLSDFVSEFGPTPFRPLSGIGGLVGMLGMGGAVAAASPDAINTLTGSFKLLSGQIGTFFIPAVARVSGLLQRASDVVESIPIGVREFVGTAAVAAGAVSLFTLAVNKASVSLAAMGVAADGKGGWGDKIQGILPYAKYAFMAYMGFEVGSHFGKKDWAPNRSPVKNTVGWGTAGAIGVGILGGIVGGAIGFAAGGPAGAVAGATKGAKIGATLGTGLGAGYGYQRSGKPPEDGIKTANSFQPEFIANPTAFYDKILMQAVKGDQLGKSIEDLQEQGNEYLRQSVGHLAKMSGEENAARRLAQIAPA